MTDLCVRYVQTKGRGVFAEKAFAQGDIVESAPVLALPEDPWQVLNKTSLRDHYLAWGAACAIALGYGSLYNHSENPNARMIRHLQAADFTVVALRDIEPGEEITITYACPPWFEVKE